MKNRTWSSKTPRYVGAVAVSLLWMAWCGRDAASAPTDPAARGLDVFVELPEVATSGSKISIDLRTFGFPTAVEPVALGGVRVDAVWKDRDDAPRTIVTDSDGVGTLELEMPRGNVGSAMVMLALSYGEHHRTQTFQIRRAPKLDLDLHVEEHQVAPGSTIPTWVLVRDLETGAPAGNVEVLMALSEGGVSRQRWVLRTDASGYASQRVTVPEADEPTFGWSLSASTSGDWSTTANALLVPREDVPAQPTLTARFDAVRLPAGSKTNVHVKLTRASGEGIRGAEVRYILGNDAEPPYEKWEKEAKTATTDEAGEIVLPYDVPVVGFATKKHLTVHAEVDGREREAKAELEIVAKAQPTVELFPEAGVIVPGLEQRIFVRVRDGWDKPVAGADMKITGDGLGETVKTDARGFAEIGWKVPKDVGASRQVGPCSGGVATTLTATAVGSAPPELVSAGAVTKCLPVDRKRVAIIRPKAFVVRAETPLGFEVALSEAAPKVGPASVSLSGTSGSRSAMVWAKTANGEVRVPETAGGIFGLEVAAPRGDGPAVRATASVLVKPRVLPKLTSRVTGGRLTPGGVVEVEAKLVDEAGAPLSGSVSGILYDRFARPDDEIPPQLDTRLTLCAAAGIASADCDGVLAGDAALAPLLRASLADRRGGSVAVVSDPGGSAKEEMRQTFNTVLKNLEGAVFESSASSETLRDVLRKGPKGNELNPEIMTLATAVLSTPPTTPGGEPFTLDDLRALDPQVQYDVVARRVTRLKMFRVLDAVRTFRNTEDLDANEPVLADPNAILRRLLTHDDQAGGVDESALRDGWGGTMQFVKAGGPGLPFINPLPGWQLSAPGPDGRLGTGDDVKDPFARVVKSGSPYARAMGEDKIVDARLDMRVGQETVSKWSDLLSEFTGTQLSTGEGFGSGHGRLGGSHRSKPPSVRMGATSVTRDKGVYVLSTPVRTDANGIAHLSFPLGADETTYRVFTLALPDGAGPAASVVDVATSLPLSVRVDGGTHWTRGDSPEVAVKVTNRTDAPIHATLSLRAAGAAELSRGEAASRIVDVPRKSAVTVPVRVTAKREGDARVIAEVKGGGLSDSIEHIVAVGPLGTRMTLSRARWVSSSVLVDTFAADDITELEGAPSLLLEGSFDPTLLAVMESLRADRLSSVDAAADAVEAFERLRRGWEKQEPALAARAALFRSQALGRLSVLSERASVETFHGSLRRARFWMEGQTTSADVQAALPVVEECPDEHPASPAESVRQIEGEPAPKGGGVAACWDAAVSGGLRAAKDEGDPVLLARLVLAFSDRDHRQSLAREMAPELAKLVGLGPTGEITMSGARAADRGAKAIVYAALVRATALGYKPAAPADTLVGWLLVQRGPDGGFGASASSRAVVEALGAIAPASGARRVTVTELDREGEPVGRPREITIAGATRVPLDRKTKHVAIAVVTKEGEKAPASGFLARIDQPVLRSFSFRPGPRDLANPLSLEVKWPGGASTAHTASLEVRPSARSSTTLHVLARIPLPPGVSLAEPVDSVKQIDGALFVTADAGGTGVSVPTLIPLRFAMAGEFTIPEATIRALSDDSMRARALATHIRVIGEGKRP